MIITAPEIVAIAMLLDPLTQLSVKPQLKFHVLLWIDTAPVLLLIEVIWCESAAPTLNGCEPVSRSENNCDMLNEDVPALVVTPDDQLTHEPLSKMIVIVNLRPVSAGKLFRFAVRQSALATAGIAKTEVAKTSPVIVLDKRDIFIVCLLWLT
jgi:hypothetical protein